MDKIIKTITKRLSDNQSNNVEHIISSYTSNCSDIKKVKKELKKLNQRFKNIKESDDCVDSSMYAKLIAEFEKSDENIFSSSDIMQMITEYETIMQNIQMCRNYLEKQKLVIVDCESENVLSDSETKSESDAESNSDTKSDSNDESNVESDSENPPSDESD